MSSTFNNSDRGLQQHKSTSNSTTDKTEYFTMKKIVNAYILFARQKRSQITARYPYFSSRDTNKLLGSMWKILPMEQKLPYIVQATRLTKKRSSDDEFQEARKQNETEPVGPHVSSFTQTPCKYNYQNRSHDTRDQPNIAPNGSISHGIPFLQFPTKSTAFEPASNANEEIKSKIIQIQNSQSTLASESEICCQNVLTPVVKDVEYYSKPKRALQQSPPLFNIDSQDSQTPMLLRNQTESDNANNPANVIHNPLTKNGIPHSLTLGTNSATEPQFSHNEQINSGIMENQGSVTILPSPFGISNQNALPTAGKATEYWSEFKRKVQQSPTGLPNGSQYSQKPLLPHNEIRSHKASNPANVMGTSLNKNGMPNSQSPGTSYEAEPQCVDYPSIKPTIFENPNGPKSSAHEFQAGNRSDSPTDVCFVSSPQTTWNPYEMDWKRFRPKDLIIYRMAYEKLSEKMALALIFRPLDLVYYLMHCEGLTYKNAVFKIIVDVYHI